MLCRSRIVRWLPCPSSSINTFVTLCRIRQLLLLIALPLHIGTSRSTRVTHNGRSLCRIVLAYCSRSNRVDFDWDWTGGGGGEFVELRRLDSRHRGMCLGRKEKMRE